MSRFIVIGGGAGGAAAAARLRRLDEQADIIIFERSSYVSSANCGLPYYIGNNIKIRDKLVVRTPEDFLDRFNILVKIGWEVTQINREEKSVTAVSCEDGTVVTETYDFCILSPGAEPVLPPIPGIDSEGVFTLRTIPDCDGIKEHVEKTGIKSALVIGAGFIGLEMAENFHDLGLDVTVVEMADQVLTAVDREIASVIQFHMKCKNIRFYTSERVVSIRKNIHRLEAGLQNSTVLSADIIIISAGVKPESKLAETAGLEIGGSGAIKVDPFMRTSDASIYAIGDAVETYHPATDSFHPCYLAGPAAKEARVAANNIVRGNTARYRGSLGTAIAKIFDLAVARTGATEVMLDKCGIPYTAVIDNPYQHAGYYPYPRLMFQKLLFCPDKGILLGASAVGYDGVDKRIDVISAIMGKKGTIEDLAGFEQAYAPPFSSAKDPVNMLGFMAENVMNGLVKMITPGELSLLDKSAVSFVDVRTREEYNRGSIEDAVNIPLDEVRVSLKKIPKDKPVYVFCEAGLRAYIACRILIQNGYEEVFDLTGGYAAWQFYIQPGSFEPEFHTEHWKKSCKNIIASSCEGMEEQFPIDISAMNYGEITLCVKASLMAIMEDDVLFFCSDNRKAVDAAMGIVEKHEQTAQVLSNESPFVLMVRKE